jgi:RNA polymerase sigma-70 factor (ECF subfamily)
VEPDAALVARAAAGEREAFGILVTRYQESVRRVTRAVTGNAEDADDAAQDAFLSALDHLETYDVSRPFGPWLLRIASNAAIDVVRRRSVRSAQPLEPSVASPGRSPAEASEDAEIRAAFAAALAELTPRQRAALTLFDVEGYAHAEIAKLLRVPEGTVRSDVFHARRALRTRLRLYGPETEE